MRTRGLIIGIVTLLFMAVFVSGFAYAGDWDGVKESGKIVMTGLLLIGGLGMALSADTAPAYELGNVNELPVDESAKIYEGSAVGDNGSGYARALTAGDPFRGFAESQVDNSSGSAGDKNVRVITTGKIKASVSGLAITDVGANIYMSDDGTFTKTAGSNSFVGVVYRYISSGVGIVAFDVKLSQDIDTAEIADSAVTTAKIADDAVDNDKIAADAVDTAQLADGAVDTDRLGADAVTNAKLADDAVSLENLDSGITPAYIVAYAGEHTTAGGGAAEVISVSGVLASDLVLVTLHTAGSTARTILTSVAGTDSITVTFSDDPSTDHVVTYMVLRAAA